MGIRAPEDYAGPMPQPRQMTLIAFMQAQNCSNYVGSWRHPSSMTDSMSPEYYQRIARTLEDAKFDLAFFDDRLAMPDIYGNDHRETVANGIRCVKLDPTIVLMRWPPSRPGSASARPTRRPTTSRSTSRACSRPST
jgi:hypothetical protein